MCISWDIFISLAHLHVSGPCPFYNTAVQYFYGLLEPLTDATINNTSCRDRILLDVYFDILHTVCERTPFLLRKCPCVCTHIFTAFSYVGLSLPIGGSLDDSSIPVRGQRGDQRVLRGNYHHDLHGRRRSSFGCLYRSVSGDSSQRSTLL